MILFAILLFTLLFLAVFFVLAVGLVGSTAIVLFGDVFVCVFVIIWLMRLILKRRRK